MLRYPILLDSLFCCWSYSIVYFDFKLSDYDYNHTSSALHLLVVISLSEQPTSRDKIGFYARKFHFACSKNSIKGDGRYFVLKLYKEPVGLPCIELIRFRLCIIRSYNPFNEIFSFFVETQIFECRKELSNLTQT